MKITWNRGLLAREDFTVGEFVRIVGRLQQQCLQSHHVSVQQQNDMSRSFTIEPDNATHDGPCQLKGPSWPDLTPNDEYSSRSNDTVFREVLLGRPFVSPHLASGDTGCSK